MIQFWEALIFIVVILSFVVFTILLYTSCVLEFNVIELTIHPKKKKKICSMLNLTIFFIDNSKDYLMYIITANVMLSLSFLI